MYTGTIVHFGRRPLSLTGPKAPDHLMFQKGETDVEVRQGDHQAEGQKRIDEYA